MIDRDEIEQKSAELGVNASDVQRDYLFGWLLSGIFETSDLRKILVLKGGNSLRKAYFPLGRFSSDLDFSTPQQLDYDFVTRELNSICGIITERTGIEFDTDRTLTRPKKRVSEDLRVAEARVYFRDFYGKKGSMTISIRIDVTELDRLCLPVQDRQLIHAYSDFSECKAMIRCIKLEEQLASKLKCLLQRRHVADLFDLVFSGIIHPEYEINRSEVMSTFLRKTIFNRNPGIAKSLLIDFPLDVFGSLWSKYIVCPISSRIDFGLAGETFLGMINQLFGNVSENQSQVQFFPAALRNPIMEAGHTTTLLNVNYRGRQRSVEPYSLEFKVRRDGVGREYFYAYDRTGGSSHPGIKAFVASGFQQIENTDDKFEPRFPVELSKSCEVQGSPYFSHHGRRSSANASRSRTTTSRSSTHVVQCPVCQKRFRRSKRNSQLNAHKDKFGNRCIGRRGYFV